MFKYSDNLDHTAAAGPIDEIGATTKKSNCQNIHNIVTATTKEQLSEYSEDCGSYFELSEYSEYSKSYYRIVRKFRRFKKLLLNCQNI
ncbi:hypothetical protein P59_255 [Bacillus phage P59]|nr:hypothetical protein P59_026 [Bacillus phage P59]QIW88852.1 hypothetical protein P59_255 [Bacillus phage P59]